MAITLADAKQQLNIPAIVTTDDTELTFFVNAANEWIAGQVTDPSTYTAQLAARMLVEHWWQTQRGPAGGVLGSGTADKDYWRSIPANIRELLPEKQSSATTPRGSFPDAVGWPDPVEFR